MCTGESFSLLATQWHVQVMPPCHYVSNSIGLRYDDQGKVYMGINFVKHGGQQNWQGGDWEKTGGSQIGTAGLLDFFAYMEHKGVFFLRSGNSPVQPLPKGVLTFNSQGVVCECIQTNVP